MNAQTTTRRFEYEADTADGRVTRGAIDAADGEQAVQRLRAMGLIVTHLQPQTATPDAVRPARRKPLSTDELVAFNQQVAQLAGAGLSLERGLKLMAADMPGRSLREAMAELAAALEQGEDIDRAIDRHAGRFPAKYGEILRAGVRSGDLSGVLAALGRHLLVTRRLRAAMWRALSYPVMVLMMLGVALVFIAHMVVPPMRATFAEMNLPLPWLTRFVFGLADWSLWIALAVGIAALLGGAWYRYLRFSGEAERAAEAMYLRWPLIGPVLRASKVAQWCSALSIAVEAGMELLLAIRTASGATGSPRLIDEAEALARAHRAGEPLSRARGVAMLPATALASIDLALTRGNLPLTLGALAGMYEQQAEHRMMILRGALLPIALVIIGLVIGLIVAAMYLPLQRMMEFGFYLT